MRSGIASNWRLVRWLRSRAGFGGLLDEASGRVVFGAAGVRRILVVGMAAHCIRDPDPHRRC
jgi:hypothetical protein